MNRFGLYLFLVNFLCICDNLYPRTITGKVVDEVGVPVSYASIYVKSDPTISTISDMEGLFSLDVTGYEKDNLVASFIGYEVVTANLREITSNSIKFVLKEQPILLEETVVSNKKPSKKMSRKEMKKLLADVRTRMAKDFPDTPITYNVVSDYCMKNGGEIVAFEELVGKLTEFPSIMKSSGTVDSVRLIPTSIKQYRNAKAQEEFTYLTNNVLKKKHKSMAQRVDSSSMIHRTMWGGDMKILFDKLAEKPSSWTFTDNGDFSLLVYKYHINLLGMLVADVVVNYVIDSYSYRIEKCSQEMTLHADIPFGYKLDKEQLALFNAVNITSDNLEKFRVKKVDAVVKRNILLTHNEYRSFIGSKSIIADVTMVNRKGVGMTLNNSAKANVLGVE